MADTSDIVIDNFDKQPLFAGHRQTRVMCENFSPRPVIDNVPGLRYWDLDERRRMDTPDNLCGDQQRAVDYYWAIRECIEKSSIGLCVGSGGIGAPGCITTDKYNLGDCAQPERYPEGNGASMLTMDADVVPWPFPLGLFGCILMNHSFEHFQNQEQVLFEALEHVKPGGVLVIIQPDMTTQERGKLDETHTVEYSADEFSLWLSFIMHGHYSKVYDVVSHNTLDNGFSFETILRRKP